MCSRVSLNTRQMVSVSKVCMKCEQIRLFSGSGFTLRNSCSRNCFAASGSPGGPVMVESAQEKESAPHVVSGC